MQKSDIPAFLYLILEYEGTSAKDEAPELARTPKTEGTQAIARTPTIGGTQAVVERRAKVSTSETEGGMGG